MTSDLRRPQTPASVVLAEAINAVLKSFAKHSSDGMVIASEALQEFWDMKCTHEQSSPSISYEIETEILNGQRCFVSYVTLPGGSCFGSSGWCQDEKSAKENAAKVALMNSVFNEHPSRQINSALINRILSNVASKRSDSNQKMFRSCLDAFKSMLLASEGKSVLMFQEMMTIFQLLHWNGNLKEMKRRKCSREEVIARYAGASMDQKMRDSMARNWKSKEMKLPGVVQTELVEAEEAMRHSREIGVDLRFHKEKRRILRLVMSELSILSPVLKNGKLQGPSPVIMDVVEDDINVTI